MSVPFRIFCAVVAFGLLGIAEGACPVGYISLLGKCYYFSQFEDSEATWDIAKTICTNELTADLLVLNDQQEYYGISDYMRSAGYSEAYIGIERLNIVDEEWVWIDGRKFHLISSLWDCGYPILPSQTTVGLFVDVSEVVEERTFDRFRVRDEERTSVKFYICESTET